MTFADGVAPQVGASACPHMTVVLRRARELPPVLVSFYALGASRHGWVVHHALPGACDRDRERLSAAGLDVATLEADGSLVVFEFDAIESPEQAAERFEPLLAAALDRGHSALWYSRFPIGPGANDFTSATAYDRAWDARFRGRPVVTLCPYVLAGDAADERINDLSGWHDAILDPSGRVIRSATQSNPT